MTRAALSVISIIVSPPAAPSPTVPSAAELRGAPSSPAPPSPACRRAGPARGSRRQRTPRRAWRREPVGDKLALAMAALQPNTLKRASSMRSVDRHRTCSRTIVPTSRLPTSRCRRAVASGQLPPARRGTRRTSPNTRRPSCPCLHRRQRAQPRTDRHAATAKSRRRQSWSARGRIARAPSSARRPSAFTTCDGSRLPDAHADPDDTARSSARPPSAPRHRRRRS